MERSPVQRSEMEIHGRQPPSPGQADSSASAGIWDIDRDQRAVQNELQNQVDQARANRERVALLREQLRQFQQITSENAKEIKSLRSERFHALQSDEFFSELVPNVEALGSLAASSSAHLQSFGLSRSSARVHDVAHADISNIAPLAAGTNVSGEGAVITNNKQDPSKEEWSDADSDVDSIVNKRRIWEDSLLEEGGEYGKVNVVKPYKAAIFDPDTNSPSVDTDSFNAKVDLAPDSQLELQHVHGYSGHDCSNNVLWLASRELIYVAASIVVIANVDDPAQINQRFFLRHKDEIGSICLHPDGMTIASGDLASVPKIYVWSADITSMERGDHVYCLEGWHTRGVIALSFSKDGRYLISVGDDPRHKIAIYDWKYGNVVADSTAGENMVFSIKCSPHDGSYVSVGVHHVMFWTLVVKSGQEELPGSAPITVWKKILQGKRGVYGRHGLGRSRTLLCIEFGGPGISLTGAKDGTIMIWKSSILTSCLQAHRGPVMSLCVAEGDGIARVVSGGKHGEYCTWFLDSSLHPATPATQMEKNVGCIRALAIHDSSDTLAVGTTSCSIYLVSLADTSLSPVPISIAHSRGSIRALCAHPSQPFYLSGGDDKCLRLWCAVTSAQVAQCCLPYEVTCVGYSPDGLKIAVGMSTNGGMMVSQPDLNTLKVVTTHNFGSKWRVPVTVVKFSPDGEYLAVGSMRERIDIFRGIALKQKLGICRGHRGAITHLDWSSDSRYLATTSSTFELFFWDRSTFQPVPAIKVSKLFDSRHGTTKPRWHTWTCNLGWPVQGLVSGQQEESDVTSVQVTPDLRYVLGGYKSGEIKVFRYPCVTKSPKFSVSQHHSGAVAALQVLKNSDNIFLISAGSFDLCLLRWILKPISSKPISTKPNSSEDFEFKRDVTLMRLIRNMSAKGPESAVADNVIDQLGIAKPYQSSICPPTNSDFEGLDQDTKWSLILEHIHGSNLARAKGNILLLKSGEVSYAAGRFCIVQSYRTDVGIEPQRIQRHMTLHTALVTALAMHPDGITIASGQDGPDSRIFIWRSDVMDVLASFESKNYGICNLMFSLDGSNVITVSNDLDVPVSLWRWQTSECLSVEHGDEGSQNVVLASGLSPYPQLNGELFVTVGIRHVKFWTKYSDGRLGVKTGRAMKNRTSSAPIFVSVEFAFSVDSAALTVTGTEHGELWLWSGNQQIKTVQAHTGPIYDLSANKRLNTLCSASNDGILRFWTINLTSAHDDIRLSDLTTNFSFDPSDPPTSTCCIFNLHWNEDLDRIIVGTSACDIYDILYRNHVVEEMIFHSQGHSDGAILAVSMHPTKNIFATSGRDRTTRIWQIKGGNILIGLILMPFHVTAIAFSTDGSALCVAMEDGNLSLLDTEKLSQSSAFETCVAGVQPRVKHKDNITCLKFSSDGSYLAAGSANGAIFVYMAAKGYEYTGACFGHQSMVTGMDWNVKSTVLQSNSSGDELHFWSIPSCQRILLASTVRDEEWASWTCRIGWPVLGAIPEKDGSLLRSVSRQNSKPHNTFVAGYEQGTFMHFPYPCASEDSRLKTYDAGLTSVDFVAFSSDDSYLVTVGFSDLIVQIWRTCRLKVISDDVDVSLVMEKPISKPSRHMVHNFETIDAVKQYKNAIFEPANRKINVPRGCNVEYKLKLEHIFSYRGLDCRKNILPLASGEVVYNGLGVVIVHNFQAGVNSQKFFLQHRGDVICLAVHPDKEIVATGEVGTLPMIYVWNSMDLKCIAKLSGPESQNASEIDGFSNVCFGGIDFELIIAVSFSSGQISIFNWRKQILMSNCVIGCEKILAVAQNPKNQDIVCCGANHVSFWVMQAKNKLHGIPGIFGKLASAQTIICAEFLNRGSLQCVLTGSISGCIFIWVETKLAQVIEAHEGPIMDLWLAVGSEDGRFFADEQFLCTGGKDGLVKLWEVIGAINTSLALQERDCAAIHDLSWTKQCSIRSLSGSDNLMYIGTSAGEIISIKVQFGARKFHDPQILACSHQAGTVPSVVSHPVHDRLALSVGQDATLRLWDLHSKQSLSIQALQASATAAAVSPNGRLVIAGLATARILLWKLNVSSVVHDQILQDVCSRSSKSGIVSVFRFFKDPRIASGEEFLLAAGTEVGDINIYSVIDSLAHLGTCRGHTSRITSIDTSVDGSILQSNSSAFELMFWQIEGRSKGKLSCRTVRASEVRDAEWTDWTCPFGWPVQYAINQTKESNEYAKFCSEEEITSVQGSSSLGLCVASDSTGSLALFPFPFLPQSGSQVMDRVRLKPAIQCSRFTGKDSILISDATYGALALWRIVGNDLPPERHSAESPKAPKLVVAGDDCFRSVSGRLQRTTGSSSAVLHPEISKPMDEDFNAEDVHTSSQPFRASVRAPKDYSPSDRANSSPENELLLEFIHGYRGIDFNANILVLDSELLYHIAGFCVIGNFKNDRRTQRIFNGHCRETGFHQVMSIAVHPDRVTIASGDSGVQPSIMIWNSKTLHVEACIRGVHRHAVSSLCFTSNGSFLASVGADEDSTMYVHDWKIGTLLYESPREASRKILLMKCNPISGTIVTCGINHVGFWRLQGNGRNVTKQIGLLDQPQTIMCLAFSGSSPADSLILAAGELGSILIWQDKDKISVATTVRPIICVQAHEGCIFDLGCDSAGIFSCGKAGWIKLWDIHEVKEKEITLVCKQSCKILRSSDDSVTHCPFCSDSVCIRSIVRFHPSTPSSKILVGLSTNVICEVDLNLANTRVLIQGHGKGRICCFAVHPGTGLFASGGEDKMIILWSKEERRALAKRVLDCEPTAIEFSADGGTLLVGLANGQVSALSSSLLHQITSPIAEALSSKPISVIRFSPRGQLLAISTMQGSIFIFQVVWHGSACSYTHKKNCNSFAGGILRLDWSADCKFLQVETDRNEFMVWEIDSEPYSQFQHTESHSEILWATKTCVLGWHTQAFLEHTGSHLRLCGDRSNRRDVIVAGSDNGEVILFKYPCPEKNAGARSYGGHAGPVAVVRFSSDDKNVFSAGLTDYSILVWQHIIIPHDEYDSEVEGMLSQNRMTVEDEQHSKGLEQFHSIKPYLSSLIAPSLEYAQNLGVPAPSLRLEYVFGCDQNDRRLELLKSGEILYTAAAIVVILDSSTMKQRFYVEHTRQITSFSVHPLGDIVLTAQGLTDSWIHVWNSTSLKTLSRFVCPSGADKVCFTADGSKVVVLGQSKVSTLALYDWTTKTRLAIDSFTPHVVFGMGCQPSGESIVTCGAAGQNGTGCVAFWSWKRGNWQKKDGFFGKVGKPSTMLCIAFTSDATKYTLTGAQNGCIYLWKSQILHKMVVGHRGPIFCLECGSQTVSGGKDGIIRVWDSDWTDSVRLDVGEMTQGLHSAGSGESQSIHGIAISESCAQEPCRTRLIVSLRRNELYEFTYPQSICNGGVIQDIRLLSQGHSSSGKLCCVCAHPTEQQFATSGEDKIIYIWDCRLRKSVGMARLPESSKAMVYSPDGKLILVGLRSGRLLCIDVSNPSMIVTILGKKHGRSITCLKYSPSGHYVAVGHNHGVINVLDIHNNFALVSKCRGPTESSVTHMDWSSNEAIIQSNTSNFELFFWDAMSGQRVIRVTQVRDEIWESWSCTMGWYVHGIDSDVSNVSCAIKARELNLVAIGDVSGKLSLFHFPLSARGAIGRHYHGHSSVIDACFTYADERVVTVGDGDLLAMQWVLEKQGVQESIILNSQGISQCCGSVFIGKFAIVLNGIDRDDWISEAKNETALIKALSLLTKIESDQINVVCVLPGNDILIRIRIQVPSGQDYFSSLKEDFGNHGGVLRGLKVSELILHEEVFFIVNKLGTAPIRPAIQEMLSDCIEAQPALLPYMDALMAPSKFSESSVEPFEELDVEHVHGFRGSDCVGNIFSLHSEGILYFMGKVAIVHDIKQNRQFYFCKHLHDISCMALHPSAVLVATCDNAENPTFCIWSSHTMEILSMWTPKDCGPVMCMTFFKQDQLFSIEGRNGCVFVLYDWKRRVQLSMAKGDQAQVIAVKWNHLDDEGYTISSGVNHLKFWSLKNGSAKSISAKGNTQSISSKHISYLSVAFPSNVLTVVGTDHGSVLVFRRHTLIRVFDKLHHGSIFDIWASNSQIFTGGEDGYIHRWRLDMDSLDVALVYLKSNDLFRVDVNLSETKRETETLQWARPSVKTVTYHSCWSRPKSTPSIIVGTSNAIFEIDETNDQCRCIVRGHADHRVAGLSPHPTDHNIFATCGEDCFVHVWHCEERCCLRSRVFRQQLTCLQFSKDGCHLAIGGLRGSLFVIYPDTLKDVVAECATFKCSQILDMKYAPNGRFLAAALFARVIQVFDVDEGYVPFTTLRGHLFPLRNLDWDSSSRYLRSTSTGYELIHWEFRSKAKVVDISETRDLLWQTTNCTFGWHIQGLLPDNSLERYITSVDRSTKDLMAVSSINGSLVILRYPCTKSGKSFKTFSVHSPCLTCARFTCDGQRLITTGGNDGAVVQWKILESEPDSDLDRMMGRTREFVGRKSCPVRFDLHSQVSETPLTLGDLERHTPTTDCWHDEHVDPGVSSEHEHLEHEPKNVREPLLPRGIAYPTSNSIAEALSTLDMDESRARLELHHVHGHDGKNSRGSLCVTADGQAIYSAGSVCIRRELKFEDELGFFLGHRNRVSCISLHADGIHVATGEAGSRPLVRVWECKCMQALCLFDGTGQNRTATFEHEISTLAFSEDKLFVASGRADYAVHVYDWRSGLQLAVAGSGPGRISSCRGIDTSSGSCYEWVTGGSDDIRFWKITGKSLEARTCLWGKPGMPRPLLVLGGLVALDIVALPQSSSAMLRHVTVAGGADGCLYIFGNTVRKEHVASGIHSQSIDIGGVEHAGIDYGGYQWRMDLLTQSVSAHDGPVMDVCCKYTESRASGGGSWVVTGGKDGLVRIWWLRAYLEQGDRWRWRVELDAFCLISTFLFTQMPPVEEIGGTNRLMPVTSEMKSMTTCPELLSHKMVTSVCMELRAQHSQQIDFGRWIILLAIAEGNIWEILFDDRANSDESIISYRLVTTGGCRGSEKDSGVHEMIQGLSVHPTKQVLATVGNDEFINLWCLARRHLICSIKIAGPGRALDWSCDGCNVAGCF